MTEYKGDPIYHGATHILRSMHAVVEGRVEEGRHHRLLNPAPEVSLLLGLAERSTMLYWYRLCVNVKVSLASRKGGGGGENITKKIYLKERRALGLRNNGEGILDVVSHVVYIRISIAVTDGHNDEEEHKVHQNLHQ